MRCGLRRAVVGDLYLAAAGGRRPRRPLVPAAVVRLPIFLPATDEIVAETRLPPLLAAGVRLPPAGAVVWLPPIFSAGGRLLLLPAAAGAAGGRLPLLPLCSQLL